MPSKPSSSSSGGGSSNKNLTAKQQRREAKKAEKKAEKKQLKESLVVHPLLGRNPHVYCGGMKVGPHWPFEVPLTFPDLGGAGAGGGSGVTAPAGWSNLNTHAIINRACLIDPKTNELCVEIVGPPVAVNSHFGSSISPGAVSVRVSCPDLKEPIEMIFVVIEGMAGVKEGMVGNEALQALNVTDIHKYKMESYMPTFPPPSEEDISEEEKKYNEMKKKEETSGVMETVKEEETEK